MLLVVVWTVGLLAGGHPGDARAATSAPGAAAGDCEISVGIESPATLVTFGTVQVGDFAPCLFTFPLQGTFQRDLIVRVSFTALTSTASAASNVDFFVDQRGRTVTLPAGERFDVIASFAPLVAGTQEGRIDFEVRDGQTGQLLRVDEFYVSGTGSGVPPTIDFGTVDVGEARPQGRLFANSLPVPLVVRDEQSGTPAEFYAVPDKQTLTPEGKDGWEYVFEPQGPGDVTVTALANVYTDPGGRLIAQVPTILSGTGRSSVPSLCGSDGLQVRFGETKVGAYGTCRFAYPFVSEPIDLLVSATLRDVPGTIGSSGFYADLVSLGTVAVPAGTTVDVVASFAPRTPGMQTQYLDVEVYTADTGELLRTDTIFLEGTADGAPPVLDFGAVTVGETRRRARTVDNGSEVGVTVETVAETDTAWVYAEPAVVTIEANSTGRLSHVFEPRSAGPLVRTLEARVYHAANGGLLAVLPTSVTGEGVEKERVPAIAVSAEQVDFGSTPVGEAATALLTAENTGDGTLELARLRIDADDAGVFRFADDPGGVTTRLLPGEAATFALRFVPDQATEYKAELVIASNDPARPTLTVLLAGAGEEKDETGEAALAVAPGDLSFGAVAVGTTTTLPLTVSNPGTGLLRVDRIAVAGEAEAEYAVPSSPFTVDAGQQRRIDVAFTPALRGTRTATLTVGTSAGDQAVPLAGVGGVPALDVQETVALPEAVVGQTTRTQVVLTNRGDVPLAVQRVTLEGGAAAFTVTAGRPVPTLAPGEAHALEVSFTPQTRGRLAATLRIASDDPDRPEAEVHLTGEGVQALVLSEETVSFGAVRVGTTAEASVTLHNPSSTQQRVTGIVLEAPDGFSVAPSAPFDLPAGEFRRMTLRYAPAARGAQAGALRLTLDGVPAAFQVALSAEGVAPAARLSADTLRFPFTLAGLERADTVWVRNVGEADLAFAPGVAGEGEESGFVVAAPDAVVPPGEARPVVVRFEPQQGGPYPATLTLETDDPAAPSLAVALQGVSGTVRNDTPAVTEAGAPVAVTIVVPPELPVAVARVWYRPGGADAYADAAMPEVTTAVGRSFSAALPGTAVTARGVEYYVQLTTEGRAVTVPRRQPGDAPLAIRVRAAAVRAPNRLAAVTDDATATAAYAMQTIPFELDAPHLAAVLEDDFGAPDSTAWRALRWDARRQTYAEHPFDVPLTPGQAFWLIRREGGTYDVEDAVSPRLADTTLVLQPGWNQLGAPYPFPVAWEDLEVEEGVGLPVAWREGQYVPGQAVLQPWEGYFVFNASSSPRRVRFVPREAASPAQAEAPWLQAALSYAVQLSARVPARGLRDEHTYFVLAAGAGKAGSEAVPEPPPPAGGLSLSVAEGGGRFMVLPKATGPLGQTWEAEVAVDGAPGLWRQRYDVVLALHEYGRRPEGFGLWVVDTDTRELLASVPPGGTAEAAAFTLKLTEGTPTRRLQIVVGTSAFAAEATEGASLGPAGLQANYPNPFAASTQVVYRLEAASEVTLSVYDALGRRVRTLAQGRQGAGRYEVAWDGRDASGVPVASGVYVVRLAAGAHRSTRRLLLIR